MPETSETPRIQPIKLRLIEISEVFMKREIWSVGGRSESEITGKTILFRESLSLDFFKDWLENGLRPVIGEKGHNKPLSGSRHPEVISFTARKVTDLIPVLSGRNTFMVGLDPVQIKNHGAMFYHVGENRTDNPIYLPELGIQAGRAPKTTDNEVWVNEIHFQPNEQFPTIPADWSITVSLPILKDKEFQKYLNMLGMHRLQVLVYREFMNF